MPDKIICCRISFTFFHANTLRNWIIPTGAPGMAATNSFCAKPTTFPRTPLVHGFYHIVRTGRRMTTIGPEYWREHYLINAHQHNKNPFEYCSDCFHRFNFFRCAVVGPPTVCSILSESPTFVLLLRLGYFGDDVHLLHGDDVPHCPVLLPGHFPML